MSELWNADTSDHSHPILHTVRRFLGKLDFVILFRTRRCPFSCYFCSLPTRSPQEEVSARDILAQFEYSVKYHQKRQKEIDMISFGNEGSILSERSFNFDSLLSIIYQCGEFFPAYRTLRLETRLEEVSSYKIERLLSTLRGRALEIITGFETQDDKLRNVVLNKYLPRQLFEDRIQLLSRHGVSASVFVLLKPDLRMSEEGGIQEAIETCSYLINLAHRFQLFLTIRLNPVYLPNGSKYETEAKALNYVPPSLLSVAKVISRCWDERMKFYVGISSEHLAPKENTYSGNPHSTCRQMRLLQRFNQKNDINIINSIVTT